MSDAGRFQTPLSSMLSERDGDDPFGMTKWRYLKRFAKVVDALPGGLLRHRPASKRRVVSPAARLRAAEKVPEALVKVASYGGGRASAVEQLDYISRDGTLEMETGDGDVIENREDIRALVDEWAKEFHQRKKGETRNTIHMVVSAPAGSNPEAVLKAGRGFAEGTFGENHPYVLVRHDDCAHPHVHIVARMRGEDGSLFRIEPGGFQELRERFAEQCREYGIEMNATPREVRGAARGESMALRKMREDGRTPEVDRQAEALAGGAMSEKTQAAIAARQAKLLEEAEAHRKLARRLEGQAERAPDQRAALTKQAAQLYSLADHLSAGGEQSRPDQVRGARRPNTPSPKMIAAAMGAARQKDVEFPMAVITDFDACKAFLGAHGRAPGAPTEKMVKAVNAVIAAGGKAPKEALTDFDACKTFLTEYMESRPPSEKQASFARKVAKERGVELDDATLATAKGVSGWLEATLKDKAGGEKRSAGPPSQGHADNAPPSWEPGSTWEPDSGGDPGGDSRWEPDFGPPPDWNEAPPTPQGDAAPPPWDRGDEPPPMDWNDGSPMDRGDAAPPGPAPEPTPEPRKPARPETESEKLRRKILERDARGDDDDRER